jgi:5-formyltetrahydrofolate cyclo-ligase
MTKGEVRAHMKRTLKAMDSGAISEASARIASRLLGLPAWKDARVVLAFLSMPGEVDTGPLIDAARAQGKLVACPRIEGNDLRFCLLEETKPPKPGSFGIREPDASSPPFDWDSPHASGGNVLIVVPGLGFDRRRRRLGRGKGFYDRFIREMRERAPGRTTAIGVCFSLQVMDEVPHDPSDLPVDGVVTENETIGVGPS